MSSADHTPAQAGLELDDEEGISLTQALTWIGEGKRLIATVTVVAAVASIAFGLSLPKVYTAHTTLLAPNSQQSGSAAALAALGSLGSLVGSGAAKSPDELYVSLLKSDSVDRELARRFDLMTRYKAKSYEGLVKALPQYIRVTSDKKSGLITVDVDDEDPKFAAALANAHAVEVGKVLSRLAVTDAQLRRIFFEKQLNDTKENLIRAEQAMLKVQQTSGLIVDKQAEALVTTAAQVRAQIAQREVELKVLQTSATDQNPAVIRLNSELAALRSELGRMEARQGTNPGSAVDLPVGQLPEVGLEYVRARREVKVQETLLETMLRQFESAKLDEAKEGAVLQIVDVAQPPDHKSKPSVALIAIVATLLGLLGSTAFVVFRRHGALAREADPAYAAERAAMARAWRWRR